jgi:hypothetical protein
MPRQAVLQASEFCVRVPRGGEDDVLWSYRV